MKKTLLCGILLPLLGSAATPNVSNTQVTYAPATGRATVTYDLANATGIVTFDVLTNGVSIGAANYAGAWGDVWQRVPVGTNHSFTWRPAAVWADRLLAKATETSLEIRVSAVPLNNPPRYLVAGLTVTTNLFFYTDEALLPGGNGVSDTRYKTDWLVLRRIPAAGVPWCMGRESRRAGRNRDFPHEVTFSADFYMAVFEMTNVQMLEVAADYAKSYTADGLEQATEGFCYQALRGSGYDHPAQLGVAPGSKLGLLRAQTGLVLDLPTDAQWEYACRAGNSSFYSVGGSTADLSRTAWWSGNIASAPSALRPLPVGLLEPNAFGLYDMLGNAWEVCLDWCVEDLSDPLCVVDPVGPMTEVNGKVIRGGSYAKDTSYCFCAHRNWTAIASNSGFRLACPIVMPDFPADAE